MNRQPLGRAAAWSRDMAIVGAATSFMAVFAIDHRVRPEILVATGIGGAVGALFGIGFRRLLVAWLRLPILAWVPISLLLGALLGGAISGVTSIVTRDDLGIALLSAVFAALAGAMQLAWFWLPYAVRAGRGKSTWPVVAAAVVLGGAIGLVAIRLLFVIIPIHVD